jgi:hypothetical protein
MTLFGRARFNPVDLETYFLALYVTVPFSTTVSSSLLLIHASRDKDLHPANVTVLDSLARDTAAIWSVRRFTPAHCKLRKCPDRAFLRRFPMDAPDIWRAARRADVALQARGVCMHRERCYCVRVGALCAVPCSWCVSTPYIKVRLSSFLSLLPQMASYD